MSSNDIFSYNEERGFFQRFGLAIGLGLVVLVAGFMIWKMASGGSSAAPHHSADMVMLAPVSAPPPPPPPPPPPNPVQNTTQQEMSDQPAIADQTPAAESPAAEAPEGLGTNLTGSGGPDYGLSHSGNGMIGGTGKGGHGGGSVFGSYAAKIQGAIAEALRQNPRTRSAKFSIKMKVWSDAQGKIHGRLVKSEGDAAAVQAITDGDLLNIQLEEPPPVGMPPVLMRFNARRPD